MLEFAIAVVSLFAGLWIGWRLRELHAQNIVNAYLKNLEQTAKTNTAYNMNVSIEKHGDQYYAFDSDKDKFLVQVKSKQELIDFFKSNHPDKNIFISKEHLELIENA